MCLFPPRVCVDGATVGATSRVLLCSRTHSRIGTRTALLASFGHGRPLLRCRWGAGWGLGLGGGVARAFQEMVVGRYKVQSFGVKQLATSAFDHAKARPAQPLSALCCGAPGHLTTPTPTATLAPRIWLEDGGRPHRLYRVKWLKMSTPQRRHRTRQRRRRHPYHSGQAPHRAGEKPPRSLEPGESPRHRPLLLALA